MYSFSNLDVHKSRSVNQLFLKEKIAPYRKSSSDIPKMMLDSPLKSLHFRYEVKWSCSARLCKKTWHGMTIVFRYKSYQSSTLKEHVWSLGCFLELE